MHNSLNGFTIDQPLFTQSCFSQTGQRPMGKRKQKVCQTNGKYEYKQLQIKGSNNMDMNRQKIMIPSNICFLGSLVHCRRSWLEQWEWGRWLWFWVKYPFCEWWFSMNIWYQITTRVHIMIMIMMHAGESKCDFVERPHYNQAEKHVVSAFR